MNILITENLQCEVHGTGETYPQVLEDAFKNLRIYCNEHVNGSIISLNANTVEIVKEDHKVNTERFLYLFLPRKRMTYDLTLKIGVEVKYINLEEEKHD